MYFGTTRLQKEIYKWRAYEIMNAWRVADTRRSIILNLLPPPKEIQIDNLPPEWDRLPVYNKLPLPLGAPKGSIVFTRGTLGRDVIRKCATFDLRDPYRNDLKMEYEPIHDKNLLHYLKTPHIKKYIENLGILTSENKVKCDLKSYNAYRHYIWTGHRDGLKEELIKLEDVELLKKRFLLFLTVAKKKVKDHLDFRAVEKAIVKRKFMNVFSDTLKNLMKDIRLDISHNATNRVRAMKEDKWIIHLVKERDFPRLRELYAKRAQDARAHIGVHFVIKWREQIEWEAKREQIKEQCRELKNILNDLKWKRRVEEQKLLMNRDFLICNDYLVFSNRRRRFRDKAYELDRIAMQNKFDRLRNKRDYSILKKGIRHQKYELAASFLMGKIPHQPLHYHPWEIHGERGFKKKRTIKKRSLTLRRKKLSPLYLQVMKRCPTDKTLRIVFLREKLNSSRFAEGLSDEYVFQMLQKIAYSRIVRSVAAHLAKSRNQLKCIVGRIRHRQVVDPSMYQTHFCWIRKLPFRTIADNVPAEQIVRKKLAFAVRRFMKHERRRARMTQKQPEWVFYNYYSSKFQHKKLYVRSHWRDLQLYDYLISEQRHWKDWNRRCKSLGKHLLYILIHNPSFTQKKKKICSPLTMLKAAMLKVKNKARIIVDLIRKEVGRKIRLYYPKEIKQKIGIVRSHVRNLLPHNPTDGDSFIKQVAFLVIFYSLYQLNIQYLGPFADKFLLNICYPKKFPLVYRKYRIDRYKRKALFGEIYNYKLNPFKNDTPKERADKIKILSRRLNKK